MANIPVIVLSTSDNPANILRCEELGCDGYFIKPLNSSFKDKIYEVLLQDFASCT